MKKKTATNILPNTTESDRQLILTIYRHAHGSFFPVLCDIFVIAKFLVIDVFSPF